MQSLLKLQILQFYTWLSQRSAQNKKKEPTKFHLALYGSHMVYNLEDDLTFTLPYNKQLFPLDKNPGPYQSTKLTLMKPQRLQFHT